MPIITILTATGIRNPKKIGDLSIDCVLKEDISLTGTVTTSPIETGESVADHVYNNPLRLTLDCVISNSDPARKLSNLLNPTTSSVKTTAVLDAYETLRTLHENRNPIDVVTGLETFTNMVIESIGITRDNNTGDALFFTCELVQVKILSRVAQLSTGGKINKGRQQGTIVTNSSTEILKRTKAKLSPLLQKLIDIKEILTWK